MSTCCKEGFKWNGTPVGKESTIADVKTYVTGSNKDVAIFMIHDVFGWTLPNLRLLADHYAKEADATVYLPDFFGGEVVAPETLEDEKKRAEFDVMAFIGRNNKEIRGPSIFAVAKELKKEYKKIGAIGFCYGGWAVFQLGAKGNNLVDAISTAHPSLLTKEEIQSIDVPVQIMAPETDPMLTPELKEFCNATIPTLGVPYQYDYYPGLVHGFAVRCDPSNAVQKAGLERSKNAAVSWFKEHLH
ncbi:hypothetical protein MBLNU459_g5230t1 [Dothideomycetes sp. NU459]